MRLIPLNSASDALYTSLRPVFEINVCDFDCQDDTAQTDDARAQSCFSEKCSYNIIMNELAFEWRDRKSQVNITKHKVSFDEAKTVFSDINARIIDDPDHSDDEDRFIIMGISQMLRVLVVCYCYRDDDTMIRIISARKATKNEVREYGT
jgi:uncharacterized DUF497 family protein